MGPRALPGSDEPAHGVYTENLTRVGGAMFDQPTKLSMNSNDCRELGSELACRNSWRTTF
jgi:hypothetical protein